MLFHIVVRANQENIITLDVGTTTSETMEPTKRGTLKLPKPHADALIRLLGAAGEITDGEVIFLMEGSYVSPVVEN